MRAIVEHHILCLELREAQDVGGTSLGEDTALRTTGMRGGGATTGWRPVNPKRSDITKERT